MLISVFFVSSVVLFRFPYKLLNLTDDPIEFVAEIGMVTMPAKRSDKCAVIPEGPILFPRKALEHVQTMSSKLSEDRARVMQFIGR